MREFWTESVLPVALVVALVLGVTVLAFDVPSTRPPGPAALAPGSPLPEPATSAETAPTIASARPRVATDVLENAIESLKQARRPSRLEPVGQAAAPGPALPAEPGTGAAPPAADDPGILTAVGALGNAVKAVHEARTEEDLLRAEEAVRGARVQMEATCRSGSGPMCQGAEQMKSLGY